MQDKRVEVLFGGEPDFEAALELLTWATRRTVLLRALIYSSRKRVATFKAAALATHANPDFANWLLTKTRKRPSIWNLLRQLTYTGHARLCANLMREWVTGEMPTLSGRRSNMSIKISAFVMKLSGGVAREQVRTRETDVS